MLWCYGVVTRFVVVVPLLFTINTNTLFGISLVVFFLAPLARLVSACACGLAAGRPLRSRPI